MVLGAFARLLQIGLHITDFPQDSQFDLEEWCLVHFAGFLQGSANPPQQQKVCLHASGKGDGCYMDRVMIKLRRSLYGY